jgi:NAD(P)-dependent dehydrogenase (short-subunit alcohol dehydrogenase family)
LNFDDLMAETTFNAFKQFRATNAANLQMAFELARRAHRNGVTSNAYTPGALQSDLMTEMPAVVRMITLPVGRTADRAAAALADPAIADRYATTTGEFYKRGKPSRPPRASLDAESQQRLWNTCARLVGVAPPQILDVRGSERAAHRASIYFGLTTGVRRTWSWGAGSLGALPINIRGYHSA